MKNDIYTKVTWIMEDNGSHLEFEFSNSKKRYVGIIDVTDKGKVSWDVIDLNYLDNIMEAVNYIMGKDCGKKTHFETRDEDIVRCSNAGMYVQLRCLMVNRKYNYSNNIDISNNYYR